MNDQCSQQFLTSYRKNLNTIASLLDLFKATKIHRSKVDVCVYLKDEDAQVLNKDLDERAYLNIGFWIVKSSATDFYTQTYTDKVVEYIGLDRSDFSDTFFSKEDSIFMLKGLSRKATWRDVGTTSGWLRYVTLDCRLFAERIGDTNIDELRQRMIEIAKSEHSLLSEIFAVRKIEANFIYSVSAW